MRRWIPSGFALAAAVLACSDDGPLGSDRRALDFTVIAPTEVATKAVVDVSVRILQASRVEYPLVVLFEKAYFEEEFSPAGLYVLHQGDRIAVARVPVRLDARIRVTLRDSSPAEVSVSKTIAIDVKDAP